MNAFFREMACTQYQPLHQLVVVDTLKRVTLVATDHFYSGFYREIEPLLIVVVHDVLDVAFCGLPPVHCLVIQDFGEWHIPVRTDRHTPTRGLMPQEVT